MIYIKNLKIFNCSINESFHWSKLPKLKEKLNKEYFSFPFGADLRGANLRGADLYGAKLKAINDKKVIIKDFMTVLGLGSENRHTIIFDTNIGIVIQCGCFYGTEKAFKKQVKETHKGTNYEKEYLQMLKLAKIRFSRKEQNDR